MQAITIFNHKAFGQIRTMTNEKGETFFVGKDIASALGYSKPETQWPCMSTLTTKPLP